MIEKLKAIIKSYKRRLIQLTVAVLYNVNIAGFRNKSIYTGNLKMMCVPGLNCYSCPGAVMSCPVGAFQNALVSNKYKVSFIDKIPFYVVGLLLLFGVLFGRLICGFLCPFGFVQELLYKIRTPKIKKNKWTRKLTYIKYIILIVFVVLLPIWYLYPAFCKYICPAGTMEAGVFHIIVNESLREIIGGIFIFKIVILIMIFIMSVVLYRFFCKFLCPLGAFYSFFNKCSFFGIKCDMAKCTHCNACINGCLMDVKMVGDRECINCGECINKCPHSAISWLMK